MAKKKNPKLNEDDQIEEDGIPLSDSNSSSDEDSDDFDPTAVAAETDSNESDDEELTGYTMGEFDLADMPSSERTEDAKILKEGLKLAKQIEGEDVEEEDDSDLGSFEDEEADIFKDFDDDDIYDGNDY